MSSLPLIREKWHPKHSGEHGSAKQYIRDDIQYAIVGRIIQCKFPNVPIGLGAAGGAEERAAVID